MPSGVRRRLDPVHRLTCIVLRPDDDMPALLQPADHRPCRVGLAEMSDRFREVLVAMVGRSPAVVTETLWALMFQKDPPILPNEIHVIVTGAVEAEVKRRLWSDQRSGRRLFERDWGIAFPETKWHLIRTEGGRVVDDVLTEADSVAVGDTAVRVVAELCADPSTRVHASLAGGRKTMSFYIGYALSLFGRAQDELTHVVVAPAEFEECKDFWYPMPAARFPHVDDRMVDGRDGGRHDAALAQVELAAVTPEPGTQGKPIGSSRATGKSIAPSSWPIPG
jgi:CRISPR-associated protein (TIGR02584 family)